MREHVKKPPPAQQEALPVRHNDVPVEGHAVQEGGHQEVGEIRGRYDVADRDQGGHGADDGAAVPVQDGDGRGVLFKFQLRGDLMYLLMIHNEEDRPDQGGLSNPTQNTCQKCLT
jgi:hypothetical protein